MPRMVGVSSCSTTWRMWRRPSACTVASCFGESPMMLFTSVTLSFFATGYLLRVAFHGPPPRRIRGLQPLQPPERVHRRLQHRAHRAARDDPGPLRGRLEIHARGPEVSRDLAGDRRVLERYQQQIL